MALMNLSRSFQQANDAMNSTYCTFSLSYCLSWSIVMSTKREPDAAPNLSNAAKNLS